MWSRREIVVGGALSILLCEAQTCYCQSPRAPNSFGCYLADSDLGSIYPAGTDTRKFLTGDESIISNSGDSNFDFALAQTLFKISQRFGVIPGFAYYDDSSSANAYATPRARLANADGTVLMGKTLFRRLRKFAESPEVAIAGVCSHEFGHILQFKYGLINKVNAGQKTAKRCELQADYFAGYFAGLRKTEIPRYPSAVVALALSNFGDSNFGSEDHHGTPDERGAAVVRGFEASFRDAKNISSAIEESTKYVLTL